MSSPEKEYLVLECAVHPKSALEIGAMVARVRDRIDYTVEPLGPRKWKVVLIQGQIEHLRKAVSCAPHIKISKP